MHLVGSLTPEQKTNAKYVLDHMDERELLKTVCHNRDGKSYETRSVSPPPLWEGIKAVGLAGVFIEHKAKGDT